MSHLPFTLLAYFFNALSVLANKSLLNKAIPDPLIYVFYISLVGILAILAIPFTHYPGLQVFNLSSISTILWTIGAYFMFKALKLGQVSRVIPIIGTIIPLLLLLLALDNQAITQNQLWVIILLILGMIFLTVIDWEGKITKSEVFYEILSAIFFATSYITLRQAYLAADFFSVIIWSRLILLPLLLLFLVFPVFRRKVFPYSLLSLRGVHQRRTTKQSLLRKITTLISFARNDETLIFIGGQITGVTSEFLLLFSISLANPALVNSLQGTQYIFLLILSREKYSISGWICKILGIGLIVIGLYLLTF